MDFFIYSRRWGHTDNYVTLKTATGWNFSHSPKGGNSDKSASPTLYDLFDHDSINYPEELPGYFEFLWDNSVGWTDQQLQTELNKLAEWINNTEKNSPSGFFSAYK